jgi:hypothetical protein
LAQGGRPFWSICRCRREWCFYWGSAIGSEIWCIRAILEWYPLSWREDTPAYCSLPAPTSSSGTSSDVQVSPSPSEQQTDTFRKWIRTLEPSLWWFCSCSREPCPRWSIALRSRRSRAWIASSLIFSNLSLRRRVCLQICACSIARYPCLSSARRIPLGYPLQFARS